MLTRGKLFWGKVDVVLAFEGEGEKGCFRLEEAAFFLFVIFIG